MELGLEVVPTNYLRTNDHGGYIIRQSDLSSWSRCQLQKFYSDRARTDADAPQPADLSITTYGSICHYAMQIGAQAISDGVLLEDAIASATKTFEHYWANPSELGLKITDWLPRQTYGGLRERGRLAIRNLLELLAKDDHYLLALEYQFAVPYERNGRLHTITGTIDRLTIKRAGGKPYLSIDDLKFGKQPTYLRYNMQGTVYGYCSTLPEFWSGWPDSGVGELETFDARTMGRLQQSFSNWGYALHNGSPHWEELPLASRRFRWINGHDIKIADGGWRNARDYARMGLAIDAYVAACEAGIYSVNQIGEVCRFCSFRKTCGGVGLPDDEAGAP